MHMCPIQNVFRSRVISLYSSKIVDKKEILHTVSNTGIYCSSEKVGTVDLVYYILKNSTVNISVLCSLCEGMLRCSSVQCAETVRNRTHVHKNFLLGMTDTMISEIIGLSSWHILCVYVHMHVVKNMKYPCHKFIMKGYKLILIIINIYI
jgi:hypothetical protein